MSPGPKLDPKLNPNPDPDSYTLVLLSCLNLLALPRTSPFYSISSCCFLNCLNVHKSFLPISHLLNIPLVS